ncbi:unnamed protein product [Spirodela intermedia]|uniref:Polyadenylate-binding protein n=1 Tax=Spirodela intermedia TaxID=51605 RepID=A0A7I8JIL0_SPIIN|nr:unnamed protein product [Spirodela intermedia]CAA6669994.1 unnamed protein product [Spirodela intermedia]
MAQVQAQPQAPASGTNFQSTSLYVGDLEINVTDSQLYDLFSQLGQVVSVRVCRDITSRRSLGYAYVNFSNPVDAAQALEMLNFTPLNGKAIRIMYSNRDPTIRKSGAANIFIKNLDKAIDNKALHDTFSVFGNILSCKIATDPSGQSKGYGFVQFEQDEAAQNAISKLNGMLLNDKQVFVGPFVRKQERDNSSNRTKFFNVFVKNLSESTTEEDLKIIFGKYGNITSSVIMREGDGKSKCFGFVNFENADDAALAVEELNGNKFDDKEWYVGKAQKKSERELELKTKFEQNMKETKLKELFAEYGRITSCKVMRDPNGVSRGSGFVAFSTPEEANRALTGMNGKMIGSKPLFVALAQRKEDRRARLQAQFSQMRPVAMPPSVAPRVPMYPPGGPGLGQQIFYGQGPPALIPPQPGFGYQQQLVPGMRPGGAPMPNFFVPMVQQGQQQVQRPGGRRAGPGSMPPAAHQPMPLLQQQGRMYRYPQGRSMGEVPMRGVAGVSQPIPIGALASALANASPEQQRTVPDAGESLYPLVEQLEHDAAAKVTGMLLEMDQTEVLHLLESPDALKAKVAEAMDVLRNVAHQPPPPAAAADQLAALTLNDPLAP